MLNTNLLNSMILYEMKVLYEYMLSDHKPIPVTIDDLVACELSSNLQHDSESDNMFTRRCWDIVDDLTILHYATYVDQLLHCVVFPRELLQCLVGT